MTDVKHITQHELDELLREMYAEKASLRKKKETIQNASAVPRKRTDQCSVGNCNRPVYCRGICVICYDQQRRSGELKTRPYRRDVPLKPSESGVRCSKEGCEKRVHRRDLCSACYQWARKHGKIQTRPYASKKQIK